MIWVPLSVGITAGLFWILAFGLPLRRAFCLRQKLDRLAVDLEQHLADLEPKGGTAT